MRAEKYSQNRRKVLTVLDGDTISTGRNRLKIRESVNSVSSRVRGAILALPQEKRIPALYAAADDLRTFAKDERERTFKSEIVGALAVAMIPGAKSGLEYLVPTFDLGETSVFIQLGILGTIGMREANATLRKMKYKRAANRFEEEAWKMEGVTESSTDRISSRMEELRAPQRRFLRRGILFGSLPLGMWVSGEVFPMAEKAALPVIALSVATGIGFEIKDGLEMRRLNKEQKTRRAVGKRQ